MSVVFIALSFILVGAIYLGTLAGVIALSVICFGFRKSATAETIGWIKSRSYERNVRKGKHVYKHYMEYKYEYLAEGKLCELEQRGCFKPREVSGRVTIVYQKKHPKLAYVKDQGPVAYVAGLAGVIAVFAILWICGIGIMIA